MSGLELLRKLKQNQKTVSVPVVYTSSSDQALIHDCQDGGCAALLRKPFDPDDLYAVVQKATEDKPRRYIRLQTCLTVLLGDEEKQKSSMVDCVTALSEDGMYISTSKPLAVGIRLPMTVFLGHAIIKVQGTVLYSLDVGRGPLHTSGMGIKFTHITSKDRLLIKEYIQKDLTQDISQQVQKNRCSRHSIVSDLKQYF